jgi:zinc protease
MAAGYEVTVDREMTVVSGRAHRDHATAYLELFAQAYSAPAFPPEDFERLRAEAVAYLGKQLRYAQDEELGKAALYQEAFSGTRYAHPPQGTVASLEVMTVDDVRAFYRAHYTADRLVLGLAGDWTDELRARLEATRAALPAAATAPVAAPPRVTPPSGRRVVLVHKPGADASISFGAPLDVRRGDPDFAALYLAISWLGEHRSSSSHLYQVIREVRGLNYGDYAYIEAYPDGGYRQHPPANVGRSRQLFEVWIRTLPNAQALFALRAALREVDRLVTEGLGADQLELQKRFLAKYLPQHVPTTHSRLLWALDDRYYGLEAPFLESLAQRVAALTREDVKQALGRHISTRDLVIAIVTGDPEALQRELTDEKPTPPTYAVPKAKEVLEEDARISAYRLGVAASDVQVLPVEEAFAGAPPPAKP